MLPVLIFDLDDTLYDEVNFVKSGITAVSLMLSSDYNLEYTQTYKRLMQIFKQNGRGKVFDFFLESVGLAKKDILKKCIKVYRYHDPKIQLDTKIKKFLIDMHQKPYLVTDGHKIVQNNKIKALGLRNYFKKTFTTYHYGRKYSKPSLYCFKKIINLENISWNDIVYIGDNPYKDFINLNKVGAQTVRVMKGPYMNVAIDKEYDAKIRINSLNDLRTHFKECFV